MTSGTYVALDLSAYLGLKGQPFGSRRATLWFAIFVNSRRIHLGRIHMKKRSATVIFVVSLILIISGCSVFMAAKQPDKKNVELFKVGTPRNLLLAEFGLPIASEVREDGKKYEVFSFVQGYSTGAKAGRAAFHGAADVLTLGLWEVVGTPTEGAFDGTEMAYEVRYDKDNKVDQVVALKKK
jgi:hypothetical protein